MQFIEMLLDNPILPHFQQFQISALDQLFHAGPGSAGLKSGVQLEGSNITLGFVRA
jgi:hypothetical protein